MKISKSKLHFLIKEEINEIFEIPSADALRTLADGLDKAFDTINELEQRIRTLEEERK